MKIYLTPVNLIIVTLLLTSCGRQYKQNDRASLNADTATEAPSKLRLPSPSKSHIKFSKVIGWSDGITPIAPSGFYVSKYAGGMKNPRQIYIAATGDVFVALANTESKGLKKVESKIIGQAKSMNNGPSANQIILFKGGDPGKKSIFLSGLHQPFGMLVLGNYFYVANTDGLWRYHYVTGEESIAAKGENILDLPAGGYNNHWTRNLLARKDGSKIYVSVGSGSNVAEHGTGNEVRRANILEINPDGTGEKIYASGLRNPVGMGWSETGTLWATVNERDELGDELVPDYATSVKEGGFYGWPYSYYGQHVDSRIKSEDQRPDLVSKAIVPDVALECHSASLGLTFYDQKKFPEKYRHGVFIGQHGSWNRSVLAGYKVMFIPFKSGKPSGPPEEFLTGFIFNEQKSEVHGRPVGVAVTNTGSLLVADDASDTIWKVDYIK